MRVRGLKRLFCFSWAARLLVAPRAGAWIETLQGFRTCHNLLSHPVRVRGLKHVFSMDEARRRYVAPRAGAWIETAMASSYAFFAAGRTPCGCVD